MNIEPTTTSAQNRRSERHDFHMNVMLLQKGRRARGCRVLNVSKGGVFLEWTKRVDPETGKSAAEHYCRGDKVEVCFSYKSRIERKIMRLPAQVMHTRDKGVGIAFENDEPAFEKFIAEHVLQSDEAEKDITELNDSTDTQPIKETIPLEHMNEPLMSQLPGDESEFELPGEASVIGLINILNEQSRRMDRRFAGLLTFTVLLMTVVVVGSGLYSYRIESRFDRLQIAIASNGFKSFDIDRPLLDYNPQHLEQKSDLRLEIPPLEVKQKIADVGESVNGKDVARIEALVIPDRQGPVFAASIDNSVETKIDEAEHEPDAVVAPGEQWIIHLIALHNQASFNKLVDKAKKAHIPVVVETVTSKGKPLYKMKVVGLESHEEAVLNARQVQLALGLEKVWINKERS